ncbi:MAG: hypothetical protein MUP45_01695 [Candidatus Marinimicrobia bacterium]|nr:hypothetical protein [Candidatus Neomarinimicrobiota bacterium]
MKNVSNSVRWLVLFLIFCLASLIFLVLYGGLLHLFNWDRYLFLPRTTWQVLVIEFVGILLWLGFGLCSVFQIRERLNLLK